METIKRYQIADYISKITDGEANAYALCGVGYNTLDETFGAQSDSKVYISEKTASSEVKNYQAQFPFACDLMEDQEAVDMVYDIGRNHKTGADAQLSYVRVELWKPVESKASTFKARKFIVSVEASNVTGAGGETVAMSGNFNPVGDFIDGEFDTKTKTFTATTTA